ncbi:MAG: EscU/YscU/HrcU family type III secretion system export apparatus switch protein [Planctomycetota bacterium]
MAGMLDEQERTEPATPRKRDEARRKGNIAASQEATTAVLLLAATLLLVAQGGGVVAEIRALIDHTMRTLHVTAQREPALDEHVRGEGEEVSERRTDS